MVEENDWSTVEVSQGEVEYEIEEPEVNQEAEEDIKIEVKADEVKDEEPKELEGIETAGAEKRIRQLVKQRKEREEQVVSLQIQNEELNKKLLGKENEVQSMGKRTLDMSEKQLTDKIALAKEVYLEAFDEGEKEKLLNAQEMLNEAQGDLRAVNSAKARYAQQAQQAVEQPVVQQQQVPQAVSDPKAEQWASDNNWFGKDNIMTAAALAIDAELKSEGYDPSDNDFYQEIDNRIKTSFPHKFEEDKERVQETTSSPAQVVSGSSRSSPSSRKKIKLSQEDLRLAQKWNIPLETYAAQKLKVHQADGDYTDIK
jgi:hypothetical protein